jgi:excinuclease ABC subunit A
MFLGQMEKPDVESIEGLSPAISIDQKTTSHNPRSTVGTVTEIYDYFRLLFARIGTPYCPQCGREIKRQTVDQIADKVMELPEGSKILVNAPVVRGKKGEFQKNFESYKKSGFARVEVDGSVYDLSEEIKLDKNIKHNVSVVVDRLVIKEGIEKRLTDSLETALKLADGLVSVSVVNGESTLYSTKYACPDCGISIEEIEPRLFSFNNPYGACPECAGLGFRNEIDENLVVKDKNKTLREGAMTITGWNLDSGKMANMYFSGLSKHYGFSLDVPVKDLPEHIYKMLLYGNNGERIKLDYDTRTFSGSYESSWEGVIPNLERRYKETTSDYTKMEIERNMNVRPCNTCHGKRLKKEALAVKINGKNIAELTDMSVVELKGFIDDLTLTETQTVLPAFVTDLTRLCLL